MESLVLTDFQLDALKEVINIGVGQGAEVLNTMLSSHVRLQVPSVSLTTRDKLVSELNLGNDQALSCVEMTCQGQLDGRVHLVFPEGDASHLIKSLTGEEPDEASLDEVRSATLTEIGNIVINAVLGSISNMFKMELKYTVPIYQSGSLENLLDPMISQREEVILLARTAFDLDDMAVRGNLILYFSLRTFHDFLRALENYYGL